MARPRRRSSNLAADPRGDTGAPAVSTLQPRSPLLSPPLSPLTASGPPAKGTKRRKARSLLRRWRNFSFMHTWVNPLIVVLLVLLGYAINPTVSNPIHKALFISYPLAANDPLMPQWTRDDPNPPTYYGKGKDDFIFVAFYVVVLSFTREFLMQRMLRPLARYYGILSRSKQSRFMEQAYTAVYFVFFGPFGLYVMRRTPIWYFNTDSMYEHFPHRSHDALFKVYYLLQASYWAQQAIVLLLQLEKPRKDFKELVAHHVLTLSLIGLSYRFHFTYMGLAVYITHDVSDFFLATAKSFNYVDAPITTPYFCFFSCVWIYLRHYINLRILYSITTSFSTIGPFVMDWEGEQFKCWLSQYISFGLLAALQAINIFWLFFILRIAYVAVFEKVQKDTRSDDEDTGAEEDEPIREIPADKQKATKANGHAKGPAKAVSSGADAGEGYFRARAANGSAARADVPSIDSEVQRGSK